ncbi:MAG: hypothetical protein ACYCO9_14830 [Streptosporangiaceae bacterium]
MRDQPTSQEIADYAENGATHNGQPDILTSEQAARLSLGDPPDHEPQNPLVYPRPVAGHPAAGAGGRGRPQT